MKTFLRILIIVLLGVFVAGALYLTVENSPLLADQEASELGERPEMPVDGDMGEQPEGDHDHHAASLSRGLAEIGVALAKLTGITLVVLVTQRAFTWLQKRLPSLSAQSV